MSTNPSTSRESTNEGQDATTKYFESLLDLDAEPKDGDIIRVKVTSQGGSAYEEAIMADQSGKLTMKSEIGTGMTFVYGPRSLVTSYFPSEKFFLPKDNESAGPAK